MMIDSNPETSNSTLLQSYQQLPPRHKKYLWALVFIALWSQVIIIAGGWMRIFVKRENVRLKAEIAALEARIYEGN